MQEPTENPAVDSYDMHERLHVGRILSAQTTKQSTEIRVIQNPNQIKKKKFHSDQQWHRMLCPELSLNSFKTKLKTHFFPDPTWATFII